MRDHLYLVVALLLFTVCFANTVYFFDQFYVGDSDGSFNNPYKRTSDVYDLTRPPLHHDIFFVFLSEGPFEMECDIDFHSYRLFFVGFLDNVPTNLTFLPLEQTCNKQLLFTEFNNMRVAHINSAAIIGLDSFISFSDNNNYIGLINSELWSVAFPGAVSGTCVLEAIADSTVHFARTYHLIAINANRVSIAQPDFRMQLQGTINRVYVQRTPGQWENAVCSPLLPPIEPNSKVFTLTNVRITESLSLYQESEVSTTTQFSLNLINCHVHHLSVLAPFHLSLLYSTVNELFSRRGFCDGYFLFTDFQVLSLTDFHSIRLFDCHLGTSTLLRGADVFLRDSIVTPDTAKVIFSGHRLRLYTLDSPSSIEVVIESDTADLVGWSYRNVGVMGEISLSTLSGIIADFDIESGVFPLFVLRPAIPDHPSFYIKFLNIKLANSVVFPLVRFGAPALIYVEDSHFVNISSSVVFESVKFLEAVVSNHGLVISNCTFENVNQIATNIFRFGISDSIISNLVGNSAVTLTWGANLVVDNLLLFNCSFGKFFKIDNGHVELTSNHLIIEDSWFESFISIHSPHSTIDLDVSDLCVSDSSYSTLFDFPLSNTSINLSKGKFDNIRSNTALVEAQSIIHFTLDLVDIINSTCSLSGLAFAHHSISMDASNLFVDSSSNYLGLLSSLYISLVVSDNLVLNSISQFGSLLTAFDSEIFFIDTNFNVLMNSASLICSLNSLMVTDVNSTGAISSTQEFLSSVFSAFDILLIEDTISKISTINVLNNFIPLNNPSVQCDSWHLYRASTKPSLFCHVVSDDPGIGDHSNVPFFVKSGDFLIIGHLEDSDYKTEENQLFMTPLNIELRDISFEFGSLFEFVFYSIGKHFALTYRMPFCDSGFGYHFGLNSCSPCNYGELQLGKTSTNQCAQVGTLQDFTHTGSIYNVPIHHFVFEESDRTKLLKCHVSTPCIGGLVPSGYSAVSLSEFHPSMLKGSVFNSSSTLSTGCLPLHSGFMCSSCEEHWIADHYFIGDLHRESTPHISEWLRLPVIRDYVSSQCLVCSSLSNLNRVMLFTVLFSVPLGLVVIISKPHQKLKNMFSLKNSTFLDKDDANYSFILRFFLFLLPIFGAWQAILFTGTASADNQKQEPVYLLIPRLILFCYLRHFQILNINDFHIVDVLFYRQLLGVATMLLPVFLLIIHSLTCKPAEKKRQFAKKMTNLFDLLLVLFLPTLLGSSIVSFLVVDNRHYLDPRETLPPHTLSYSIYMSLIGVTVSVFYCKVAAKHEKLKQNGVHDEAGVFEILVTLSRTVLNVALSTFAESAFLMIVLYLSFLCFLCMIIRPYLVDQFNDFAFRLSTLMIIVSVIIFAHTTVIPLFFYFILFFSIPVSLFVLQVRPPVRKEVSAIEMMPNKLHMLNNV
ncbi:hypothetical protein P9112_012435 [Eukaryota sp. TZLM1-RC]